MAWSLSYKPPKEANHLDAYLLAIGKALYVATMFEAKCLYLLPLIHSLDVYNRTKDAAATLSAVIRQKFLGATITGLQNSQYLKDSDIKILDKARFARNYIAHESAKLGELCDINSQELSQRLEMLRENIIDLSSGDNLISTWLYEFQEKINAPQHIQNQYEQTVMDWVLYNGKPYLVDQRP